MRYPTRASRHWKIAAKAVANYLASKKTPVLFFDISSVADRAAREDGRKSDLFPSLFDYVCLLPGAWTTSWLGASEGSTGDSLYFAVPRGFVRGEVKPSLTVNGLLGSNDLVRVDAPDA